MKRLNLCGRFFTFAVASLLTTLAGQAASPPIGANFQGRGADGPTTLGASDNAGVVVVQGNWNNVDDDANGNKATTGPLNDATGAATAITLTYNANDSWNNDGQNNGGDPNFALMRGIIKPSNNSGQALATFSFNNVPLGVYDLYVYCNVNGDNRTCDFTAGGKTYYVTLMHQFTGTFQQATNSTNPGNGAAAAPRDLGNWIVFKDVVPSSGTIALSALNRVDGGGDGDGSGIAALQLIPKDPPLIFAVQPADAPRYAGQNATFSSAAAFGTPPYTYQWYTNGVQDASVAGQAANYSRVGIAANENGRTFQVIATDSTSVTVTSRLATLTVFPDRNVSLSFVGRGGGYYLTNTELAGVVPLTNWNNNQSSGEQNPAPGDKLSGIVDDFGGSTPFTLHWECNDSWNTDGPFPGPDGNYNMMKGIAKDGTGYTGYFNWNNLPPDAAFDVYVYTAVNNGGDMPNPGVRYDIWVTNQASSASGTTSRTNYNRMPRQYTGSFTRAENFNPAGPYPGGEYVKFTNVLSSPSGNLYIGHRHVSGGDGAAYPGIQLIRRPDVTIPTLTLVNASLTQTPSPVFEGSPFTLSGPNVQGVGSRTYQWQTNTANDLSGTWVTIPGANGATYTATPLFAQNGSQYRVIVGNYYPSFATSSPIALQVVQDVTAPTLVTAVGGVNRTSVTLIFSEPMNTAQATTAGNYSITNAAGASLAISAAALSANGKEVTLTTAAQATNAQYWVVITGLHDRAALNPNLIAPNPTVRSFTSFALSGVNGQVLFRAYNSGAGNGIGLLLADPTFPNSPDFSQLINTMNSRAASDPAHPGFYSGDTREAFGGTIAGQFVAPSSGNWIFYISSDDDGSLVMNTNGPNAVGASEVRFAPGCCRALSGGADPSPPISMIAGQAYYIEARYKEGTGGDYVSVGARLQGDGSAIVPITAANLAFFATLTITQQPTNYTAVQGQYGIFSVVAVSGGAGSAPQYQWQRSVDTAGTSFTNIPSATAATLSFQAQSTDDQFKFQVIVSIPGLVTNVSSAAVLTVVADTTPPVLLSVTTDASFKTIFLKWSETMDPGPAGAGNGNYILFDPFFNQIDVSAVDYLGSNYVLHIDPGVTMDQNTTYSLEIDNQQDLFNNRNNPVGTGGVGGDDNAIVTNFTTLVITRGFTRFQAYTNIGTVPDPNVISFLQNKPAFPNSPDFSFLTNVVNWPQTVNPNIENYGMRFSGLFIAPVDGSYTFKAIHDDGARLYFSTDSSEANKVAILNENCCNGGYTGVNSDAVTLTAGSRYYYELIVLEGGGGDYAGLGVNIPGGGFVAPITGQYLALAFPGGTAVGAGIAVQPQNRTIDENHTATFSVVVTNAPNVFYQWQINTNGTFIDIAGANSTSYTTPYRTLANNGEQYRVIAYVPASSLVSSVATLTVIADANKPIALRARGVRQLNGVQVLFNEVMDTNTLAIAANYTLSDTNGPIVIGTPVPSADGLSVILPTPDQVPGSTNTLTIQNVTDLVGNSITTTNFTFQLWRVGLGSMFFDVFGGLDATQTLPAFTNNPAYPNSPSFTKHVASANSRLAYPDDSHEGYGGRLSGYIVPPVTGNYTFYVSSDDDSVLQLSTNSSPTNITDLIFTPSCCAAFSAHSSAPQSLVAGQPYYIQLLYKEGTGGDFGMVAAKLTADPTNPDTLPTINGAYLASLADPVGASITFTQQPVSTAVVVNASATLRVGVTTTNDYGDYDQIAYQWQQFVGGVWVNVLQANGATYTTTPLGAGESRQYRVIVYIPGANATSAAATVNGPGALRITRSGETTTLSWTGIGTLQEASEVTGPWSDSGNQSNPQTVATPPGTKKFFRLR